MAADDLPRVFLESGRDRRFTGGHPWAYSNEVRMDAAAKAIPPGALARLCRVDGKPIAVGTFNPHTLIAFRAYDRNPARAIDAEFFAERIARAAQWRARMFDTPYVRLAHAEADGLPAIVADRFGDTVVLQTGSAGAEALIEPLTEGLVRAIGTTAVVLRNDAPSRALEGLDPYVRVARGEVSGPIELEEGGVRFLADVLGGQKTGWFYDQRDNRAFVARLARNAARVLDVYCYSGGFALMAAKAGAREVVGVDRSDAALALAQRAATLNGLDGRVSFRNGDAFEALEAIVAERTPFDVVVCDPPPFARSKKDVGAALKGYRKLARLAAQATAPGGFLFLASCSHNVAADALLADAARGIAQAGREARLIRAAGADADHPVHPHLPETAYLKALVFALD